jgi:hypothetical protein
VGPAALVRTALFLLIFGAAIVTPADADLWGHLAFGRDIVSSSQPIQADSYSFTADRPWINHEWLSEVAFFTVYRIAGASGLIAFKLSIIAAVLISVWWYLRAFAAPDLRWILVAAVFAGTFWRTHNVRPQLFSVLLFALLLICIRAADSGRQSRLWLVPPIAALWVNLHGGWILGLGIYGLWAAARLADTNASSRERALPIFIGVLAAAATLINPWGPQMWAFLGDTVRPARADIEEWSPIAQYPLVLGIPWGLTLAAVGVALWRGGPPRRLDYLAIIGLLSVLAFLVGRLDAFFVMAVVVLLAPQFARSWPDRKPARSLRPQPAGAVAITVVAMAAVIVPVARFAAPYSTCLPISGAWAPDAQAAQFISENKLSGHMMTWFDWGEFAIWHFGPGLRVSIDGRRETLYSDRVIQSHRSFYAGGDAAMSYLRELTPDFVWLPAGMPVARQLAAAGWIAVFDGPVSRIWARSPVSGENRPASQLAGSEHRCFPGP